MNRFRGDRLPTDDTPLTDAERERASIPVRFTTRQEHRDYMRDYMRMRRARTRLNLPTARKLVQVAAVAVRRHDRPGRCGLCGHAFPEPTCPVCIVEMAGNHVAEAPHAWEVLLSAATL